jgi:putative ATP-dependent endonuclease of the OLD family
LKLTRIGVTNHSRVQDLDLEVRNHMVLVGPNEVGKSSVLRCMDLLLGASTAQLYSRIGPEEVRAASQPMVIEADLADFSADHHALFPDEITVDPFTGAQTLTIRLEAIFDANQTLSVQRTAPSAGTNRQISRDQLAGIGWTLLGATASARDLRDDRRSALDDILRAVDLGSEKQAFDALVEALRQNLRDSTVLSGIRDDLAEQLSRALPEKIGSEDLEFVPGAAADSDVLSDVRLQVTKQGVPRNLSQQSDGMRALYAIALYDLVSVGANMVGIDEPEIHLHPTSQRSLARLLQEGPNQKFLATHSPDIVSAFAPECIVAVRHGGSAVQPTVGFLTDDESMAVRWWVRNRLEPLTARRVVGVEGISDRIVLQRAAELTRRPLDQLGVSVVEVGGSHEMRPIYTLFGPNGFDIPMSRLIDVDAADETAEDLGVDRADLQSNSVWVSDADLEDEYVRAISPEKMWAALSSSSLFTRNELSNAGQSTRTATPTQQDVSAFCRMKKYKVRAAIVAASILDEVTSRAIASLDNLLNEVTPP